MKQNKEVRFSVPSDLGKRIVKLAKSKGRVRRVFYVDLFEAGLNVLDNAKLNKIK